MSLRLRRVPSAGEFLTLAGDYLLAREDANCLVLGLAPIAEYRAVVVRDDEVVAAAVRTPPRPVVLSELADPSAADLLADDLRASELAGERVPGVTGPPDAALRVARRWGGPRTAPLETRAYRADTAIAPAGVAGSSRSVTPADRRLLLAWTGAFLAEAVPDDPETAADATDRLLAEPETTWLWIDHGVPASMARYGGQTANSVRIGFVYTPPEQRGRGYASVLVATMTQAALDRGWAFVTLFADLGNPTSNRIYKRIGYHPVCDHHTYRF